MRATIERGLALLTTFVAARDIDPEGLLVAPADSVGLTTGLVAAVIDSFRADPDCIIVPVHHGRRGHPLALTWADAVSISTLPQDVGVNALLDREQDRVREVVVPFADLAADIDTPEDYRRWSP